jgi:hypothetical protein
MKKFFMKSSILAALVGLMMLTAFLVPAPYNHDLSAVLNKRDLLKDGRTNRVVVVGGSGIYSALDSEMLEKRLGRPVLNVGLWAGFGLTAVLREIKPYLHAGDVVVLIPEYGMVYDDHLDASRKWIFALSPVLNVATLYRCSPAGVRTFALDFISLVRYKFEAIPHAVREALRLRSLGVFTTEGYIYYRKYFNANGDSSRIFPAASSPDMIAHRNEDYFSLASYQGQSLNRVNEFCTSELKQGVETLLVFPAYPREEYEQFQDGVRRYEERLRTELACPVLGTPRDFLYPYLLFTDTIHHLGVEGKRRRSERLAELLAERLGPSSRSMPPVSARP